MPKIRPDQLRKVVREAAASPVGRSAEELAQEVHAHKEQLFQKARACPVPVPVPVPVLALPLSSALCERIYMWV